MTPKSSAKTYKTTTFSRTLTNLKHQTLMNSARSYADSEAQKLISSFQKNLKPYTHLDKTSASSRLVDDTPPLVNGNHMTVIRESHASLMSRKMLSTERQRILQLDLSDSKSWNNLRKMRRKQLTSQKD